MQLMPNLWNLIFMLNYIYFFFFMSINLMNMIKLNFKIKKKLNFNKYI